MKHFVLLFVTYNDGTADKKALYDCKDETEALAMSHRYAGQYIGSAGVATVLSEARNSVGGVINTESWAPSVEKEA